MCLLVCRQGECVHGGWEYTIFPVLSLHLEMFHTNHGATPMMSGS